MATISEGGGPSLTHILAAISSSGLFLYLVYGAIWRLYFSPIAMFPGPRFAALTFWNQLYYDIILGGKYTWKIADYHKAYGRLSNGLLLILKIERLVNFKQVPLSELILRNYISAIPSSMRSFMLGLVKAEPTNGNGA